MSLTDRETMRLRMLLGRSALAGRAAIVPDRSCVLGEPAGAGGQLAAGETA